MRLSLFSLRGFQMVWSGKKRQEFSHGVWYEDFHRSQRGKVMEFLCYTELKGEILRSQDALVAQVS